MQDRDEAPMRRALDLAERGWGRVAPNPLVGAVVVRDGVVVAEGYHSEWGAPHAEVEALEAAGEQARGATLYVTLEPCHHTGKTGPCSRRIAAAGISRVVCATAEVNPDAKGGGEWLRGQGVEVEFGVCERVRPVAGRQALRDAGRAGPSDRRSGGPRSSPTARRARRRDGGQRDGAG
jgi:diaminohydroxyphosphoribosylaminopyrimidine deaminase/5-amino-6-(5-phosphoribosylamino)uracil reductase